MSIRNAFLLIGGMVVILIVGAMLLIPTAVAVDLHYLFHASYNSWVNRSGFNCCNDQDCRPLEDEEVRVGKVDYEVKIDGAWCPVLEGMYLRSGNAPNDQVAHACIRAANYSEDSPCSRLLCFQPKPGF